MSYYRSPVDTSRPHSARVYDYLLGGKDNFAADRELGDKFMAAWPGARSLARNNRAFMRRTVAALAREEGVRQFLDIGTGLPTRPNLHEVVQEIAPESRIVYVDNDPLVLTHARALLTSSPQGRCAYIEADIREPDKILRDPDLLETLDLTKPVALTIISVSHFLLDDDDPYGIVSRLVSYLPSGSYLVMSQITYDPMSPQTITRLEEIRKRTQPKFRPRTLDEFTDFFRGLILEYPGIVPVTEWRPESEPTAQPQDAAAWAGVARIP